ncbi:MAG TPA: YjbE family putative metal transport protein [Ktedonobacterales bacterium]|nr:YjbE family putative metal transport protein [Ktedonobacterales bacterium]
MDYSIVARAAAIALLDIVLSGDNALVIGVAASRLERSQRYMAIVLGGAGAIVLRLLLASVATTLLLVPYLRFAGGVVILVIAVRLLLPERAREDTRARDRLGAAIVTILLADVTMSTDNVIAVGGLADGNIVLIVAGVTLSMLLLFVASSVIARVVERVSWLLDLAAIVLGWTAANLALNDPGVGQLIRLSEREEAALHFYLVALIILIDLLVRAVQRRTVRRAVQATAPPGAVSSDGADGAAAMPNGRGASVMAPATDARAAGALGAGVQQPRPGPHSGTAGER